MLLGEYIEKEYQNKLLGSPNFIDDIDEVAYKRKSHSIAAQAGVLAPQVYLEWEDINTVNFNELPDLFALHTNDGCCMRGVYLLQRISSYEYLDLNTNLVTNEQKVKQDYKVNPRIKSSGWAEELLYPIPDSFFFYVVNHQIGLIRRVRFINDKCQTTFDANLNLVPQAILSKGFPDNLTLAPPREELLAKAIELSNLIPKPFCRIDLYDYNDKIYISEFTPLPGERFIFHPKWDELMGKLLIDKS